MSAAILYGLRYRTQTHYVGSCPLIVQSHCSARRMMGAERVGHVGDPRPNVVSGAHTEHGVLHVASCLPSATRYHITHLRASQAPKGDIGRYCVIATYRVGCLPTGPPLTWRHRVAPGAPG